MPTPSPNDRIELIHTDDKYTSLSPGDKGTVTAINEIPPEITPKNRPETQIDVDWDDGSTLSLIDSQDEFKIINRTDT